MIGLESVSLLPIKTDKKTRLGNQDSRVQKPNDCVASFLVLLYHSVDSDRMVGGGKPRSRAKGYFRREYGEQIEIDIRLPYKGFRELPLLKGRELRVQAASDEKCVQAFGEFREEQTNGQVDNY